jgi:hypothetical protein
VTIIAVLAFISAAFLLLGGLLCLLGGAWLATMGSHRAFPFGGAFLGAMGAVCGVILLTFAALSLAAGIGLLGLKSWARVLTIVLLALGLAVNVLALLGGWMPYHLGFGAMHLHHLVIRHLIGIALDVWILYYLFQPHVKKAFGVV